MSFPQWGDIPTWGLFAGAVFTSVFAFRAFGKQAEEVTTLQQQAADQQELTRQQGEQLKVQAEQLVLQRQQLDEQRVLNARQVDVLELQAQELKASIDQRERDISERHRAQAVRVFVWEERLDHDPRVDQATLSARGQRPTPVIVAHIKNASEQPIYGVLIRWHRGTAPFGEGSIERPLMPGEEANAVRDLPADLSDNIDPLVFGAVAYFLDAAGSSWRAHPDGRLDEIH